MPTFRVALTGDFLNVQGEPAYGDMSLDLLVKPFVRHHFLSDQAPDAGDPTYWDRLYSMEIEPRHIRGVNGLVVLRPWVKRESFAEGADELVVIGRSGAGYDKVDVAACTENDVALFNAPQALNHPTATAALLLMLALAKKLRQQERITRAGRWDLQAEVMGDELQGRSLGIVGLGHSGRELVRLVSPFAMRVLAYSPHADPEQAAALGVRLTALEVVLREADFLSLHCRLNAETRGLIGRDQLALLKPTAYLVNVARGGVIDQDALVEVLRAGRIAGAGLDVFEPEPLPAGHPLLELDNVIATPHWLASSRDVWRATGRAMAEGILRAATGQVPGSVVNAEALERPKFREKLARFRANAGP